VATYAPAIYQQVYTGASTTSGSTLDQWLRPLLGSNTAPAYAYNNTTTSATWDTWVNVGHTTTLEWQQEVWGTWIEDEAEMAEHRAMRQRQRDELQQRREQRAREELAARQEREAQLAQARVRARELLEEMVAADDWVPGLAILQVAGSDGELYRIEMHRETVHGNVVRVDQHGCLLGRACVAPEMYDGHRTLPTEDGWVGQYLGLKFDAEEFLSHANWSSVQGCRQERVAA
jgi:hypothetical protein